MNRTELQSKISDAKQQAEGMIARLTNDGMKRWARTVVRDLEEVEAIFLTPQPSSTPQREQISLSGALAMLGLVLPKLDAIRKAVDTYGWDVEMIEQMAMPLCSSSRTL